MKRITDEVEAKYKKSLNAHDDFYLNETAKVDLSKQLCMLEVFLFNNLNLILAYKVCGPSVLTRLILTMFASR